jgi:hypothetical protein
MGPRGTGWFIGTGAPPSTIPGAVDGDLYLDLLTSTDYLLGPIRVADLPAISSSFQGGYYAGVISHTANGVETHALIISPKAVGSALNLAWKTANTATTGTMSVFDGWANGEAMNNASHLAAEFCRSLSIGGYDDWYLPATPVLTSGAGMEAGVAERAGALLVLAAGDAHQPHAIAQVVLQGTGDAAAQIGPSGLASSAAWSGADQGLAGHLDQILPLHQREQAPGHDGGNGIGKGQVLDHQGITGRQGRAAEGGSGGSHRQDGEEPHPHRSAAAQGQGRPTPEGARLDP